MFARTERLLLRPGWSEDAPALYEAICDEGIVRNLARAPWPYRLEDAESFLAREAAHPLDARWLIFLRTDGAPRLAGSIGFGRTDDGKPEFGYWIARRFWGRGIATEAGGAIVGIARDALRLKRLEAGHFLDNPASGRVLAKLGFRPTGAVVRRFSRGRGEEAPCRLFELDLEAPAEAAAPADSRAMAA
ncbi:MAG TPA: GNAT family N-acetyltransferase [Allosphingosinicella sp.]